MLDNVSSGFKKVSFELMEDLWTDESRYWERLRKVLDHFHYNAYKNHPELWKEAKFVQRVKAMNKAGAKLGYAAISAKKCGKLLNTLDDQEEIPQAQIALSFQIGSPHIYRAMSLARFIDLVHRSNGRLEDYYYSLGNGAAKAN